MPPSAKYQRFSLRLPGKLKFSRWQYHLAQKNAKVFARVYKYMRIYLYTMECTKKQGFGMGDLGFG